MRILSFPSRPLHVLYTATFQHRVEDAASVIQRSFRTRLAAPSPSSVEKEGDEEENLDATGKEQETDEGEKDEDGNDKSIITMAFVAIFAAGIFLFKSIASAIQDTGGAEKVVLDGNMSTQTGTFQAAPQIVPFPQPPP
jgi:hypothetical protein